MLEAKAKARARLLWVQGHSKGQAISRPRPRSDHFKPNAWRPQD